MIFANKQQLNDFLKTRLKVAVDNLVQDIYTELLTFIQEDIYLAYNPKKYERTFEFRDKAWNKSVKEVANEIVGEVFYDGMNMSYNPSKFQHGNAFEDRRERLAEILNNTFWDPSKYIDSDWDFGMEPWPKPFWGHTMAWLEDNWDTLVKNALREVGLK